MIDNEDPSPVNKQRAQQLRVSLKTIIEEWGKDTTDDDQARIYSLKPQLTAESKSKSVDP